MQAHGSLALEDRSEVGEGRCSADVVFPASAPVPFSSQPKKQTHSLQWVLLGEDVVISPTCEVGGHKVQFTEGPIVKGPRMVLGYLFTISQPNLSFLVGGSAQVV